MSRLDEIPTPALLLDLDVLEANLSRMAKHADDLGVKLRPHIKTHKCVEVAELQRQHGCSGITVSTLYEAGAFADNGFDDITWAFPVILSRLGEARELAERIRLGLVVDSVEAVDALRGEANAGSPLRVWMKVDCGYRRAGVDPASDDGVALARLIDSSPELDFAGILTHSGHAYHAADREDTVAIAEQERSVMTDFAERLRASGIEVAEVSVGSTPAMSAVESLEGITEARPGNYAFYDNMQCELGSCTPRECALTVLASVVSRQADHAVVDAGALAMSKDAGPEAGTPSMGPIYADYAAGELEADLRLSSVSQEHGIVNEPLPIGKRLRILPNHSCLTAACFDEYHVVRGDEVVDRWRIWRGR